jgi:hypothetical protein
VRTFFTPSRAVRSARRRGFARRAASSGRPARRRAAIRSEHVTDEDKNTHRGRGSVLLGANCSAHSRSLKNACGVATRSAAPTLDPASAHQGLAPARRTGQEQANHGVTAYDRHCVAQVRSGGASRLRATSDPRARAPCGSGRLAIGVYGVRCRMADELATNDEDRCPAQGRWPALHLTACVPMCLTGFGTGTS